MTDMNIESGVELDRLVSEAIGEVIRGHDWRHTGLGFGDVSVYVCKVCGCLRIRVWGEVVSGSDPKGPCVPPYSTDLRVAFFAAEKVGLWDEYGYCRAAGQHVISKEVPIMSWADTLTHNPTSPTLAICEAILKLKGMSGG